MAGPDGEWVVDPETVPAGTEHLLLVDIDPEEIRRERQNFDPAGHYARPDVFHMTVDRRRTGVASFIDDRTPSVTPMGTPLVDSIEHLVLTVRDPDHAVRFYRRVLGFEEVRHEDDTRSLRFGDQRIELRTEEDGGQIAGSRPTWGSSDLCLVSRSAARGLARPPASVRDPDALGPVHRPGTRGPLRSIHFRDPDGNLVEIANRRTPREPELCALPRRLKPTHASTPSASLRA